MAIRREQELAYEREKSVCGKTAPLAKIEEEALTSSEAVADVKDELSATKKQVHCRARDPLCAKCTPACDSSEGTLR
jgi:hypothetical protein